MSYRNSNAQIAVITSAQAHEAIALRVAIDMKLFDAVTSAAANGHELRIAGLAASTGVEPLLLGIHIAES